MRVDPGTITSGVAQDNAMVVVATGGRKWNGGDSALHPNVFVTLTVYEPESPGVRVRAVAPTITLPLRIHWYDAAVSVCSSEPFRVIDGMGR